LIFQCGVDRHANGWQPAWRSEPAEVLQMFIAFSATTAAQVRQRDSAIPRWAVLA
jgi:hypothetical protein